MGTFFMVGRLRTTMRGCLTFMGRLRTTMRGCRIFMGSTGSGLSHLRATANSLIISGG
ncbi:MAG: hypothetical protein IJT98_00890 [Prevotella sp.]|nr:hypothetical protein [Prevotella sp.]